MIKIIRKNQRVVMVVMGVGLMIMFLVQLAPQTGATAPVLHPVATIGGAKITQRDVSNYAAEWELLKRLAYMEPSQSNSSPEPLVSVLIGPQLAGEIDQTQKSSGSPPLFMLLVQEADRQGILVSDEDWQSLLTNRVYPLAEPGTDEREQQQNAVVDCLKITKLVHRAANVIKISQPLQEYQLMNAAQSLVVNVEPIRASDLLKDVKPPTDAQIQAQFDKYSNRIAAIPDRIPSQFGQADDPLGFGYKVPNRVTIQYIGLNPRDVAKAAIASKSNEDWYVAAFGEFKANREQYDSQNVPATQPASTQPDAPRKLANLDDDFALHANLVLESLYKDAEQALEDKILHEMSEKLSSGFGTYRDAMVTHKDQPPTGDAAAYLSYNAVRDVANSIADQYHVTPIIGNIQQFKSEEQLGALEGIGSATLPESNGRMTFPMYAVELFQPWLSEADKNSQRGALAIAQWQPSNPVVDSLGNKYIFRVTGSDPEHVPALKDVRDQVIADFKISMAYALAQDHGRALLKRAAEIGLTAAAKEAKLPAPIVTDSFNPERIISGQEAAVISPLYLSPDSARELAQVSQQLLITPPAKNGRPQVPAELFADRTVAPVELREAKPDWDEQSKPWLLALVADSQMRELRGPLTVALFRPDAVAARLDYKALPKASQ